MPNNQFRICFIGDIVGKIGRKAVQRFLEENDGKYDLVIANGENASGGKGITPRHLEDLLSFGVDVITSGNHIWHQKDLLAYMDTYPVIRPANYPPNTPGKGSILWTSKDGLKIGISNLIGRVFMEPLDCPFRVADEEIKKIKQETDIVLIDFHAETTSEKIALGYYLDGRVTAIIGTHTHVQTNDIRLFPNGTMFVTDAGMTGSKDSVIGVDYHIIVEKYLTALPQYFELPKEGEARLDYIDFVLDRQTKQVIEYKADHAYFL